MAGGTRSALRRVRSGARRPVRRLRRTASDVRAGSRARALLAAGILDVDYYRMTVKAEFANDFFAARHCVRRAMPRGLSPSPFLELWALPEQVQDDWLHGRIRRVLRHLRSPEGLHAPYGRLFHPDLAAGTDEAKAAHPGGALGLFLSTATDATPVPVPVPPGATAPTLGEARARMMAAATEFAHQRGMVGPRTTTEWDLEAEAAWKSQWTVPGARDDGPVVSVITPVRNRPELILRAIQSVQAQTFAGWELVVVDDGSTDSTPDVVRRAAEADPRIRLVPRDWSGVSAARNAGIEAANGSLLAFLDSDNTWRADFLALAVAAMEARGLQVAYAGAHLHDPAGDPPERYRVYDGSYEDLLVVNHVDLNILLTSTELARRVGGFDTTLKRWVDHDFAIRLAAESTLEFLPFIGCDYDDAQAAGDRITLRESDGWQFVVLGKHYVDWPRLVEQAPSRVAGRTSLVIVARHDVKSALATADSLLQGNDDVDLELVVVGSGAGHELSAAFTAMALVDPRVSYRRVPRRFPAGLARNIGFASTTGAEVGFVGTGSIAGPEWRQQVRDALGDPSVVAVRPLGGPSTTPGLFVAAGDFLAQSGYDPRLGDDFCDIDLALRLEAVGDGRTVAAAVSLTDPPLDEESAVDARMGEVDHEARWGRSEPVRR